MSSEGLPQGQSEMPNLQVMAQYIKDLSFENPGAVGEIHLAGHSEQRDDENADIGEAPSQKGRGDSKRGNSVPCAIFKNANRTSVPG